MSARQALVIRNAGVASVADLPMLPAGELRAHLLAEVEAGARLCAFFGVEPGCLPHAGRSRGGGGGRPVPVVAVVARDSTGELALYGAELSGSYASLTPACTQAHWFERELWEQWGPTPEGHPWLKPIRFEPARGARTGSRAKRPVIGGADFFRVEGAEVHEVAVGPVHAGVIEPGHFRFQCHGETVYHLEISLGYQHRGVERALQGGPDARTPHLIETLAGDTTIGHALASCGVSEALADVVVPPRAATLRALMLELERLANHIGDLGALAGDVGFLPTSSYCGRIRGDVLNMTALVCGNRFGRSMIRPGGVLFDASPALTAELRRRMEGVLRDARIACDLLWRTPAVMARFEGTGPVTAECARDIGLVGPAARASGLPRDVRADFPSGWYASRKHDVCREESGDVLGRARVRWAEVEASARMVEEMLGQLDGLGPLEDSRPHEGSRRTGSIAVGLAEGWRGEVCHVAVTDRTGRFAAYKVVDPSFHNWFGLACALRDQEISDFPLCNKSFNLSYCGHDL